MRQIGKTVVWLVMGAVFAAVSGRLYYANNDPPADNFPVQVLPKPNALDTYREAFEKLPQKINPKSTYSPELSLKQRQAALEADAEGLRLAHLAQTQTFVFPRPPNLIVDPGFHYFAKLRALARLYAAQGETRLELGDERGAMNSYLDAMVMGQQQQNSGTIINRLVGFACQSIGRRYLWEHIHAWSGDEAKAGARRMETINAAYVPMSVNFAEERNIGVTTVRELLSDPKIFYQLQHAEQAAQNVTDAIASTGEVKQEREPSRVELYFWEQLYLFQFSKRDILRNYQTYLDAVIAQAKLPYAKRGPAPKLPLDPLLSTLAPAYPEVMFKDDLQKTQNVLLTIALALQAYKAEHGTYPETLKELCPAYLTVLPADPFSRDGATPPLYRRTGDNYVLYSIGPDGKDDGGKAIQRPNPDGTGPNYNVTSESRGDIVAGKNLN